MWAGVYWQNPVDNWGTVPGQAGYDLSRALTPVRPPAAPRRAGSLPNRRARVRRKGGAADVGLTYWYGRWR